MSINPTQVNTIRTGQVGADRAETGESGKATRNGAPRERTLAVWDVAGWKGTDGKAENACESIRGKSEGARRRSETRAV